MTNEWSIAPPPGVGTSQAAESKGFEPLVQSPARQFSRLDPSAARTALPVGSRVAPGNRIPVGPGVAGRAYRDGMSDQRPSDVEPEPAVLPDGSLEPGGTTDQPGTADPEDREVRDGLREPQHPTDPDAGRLVEGGRVGTAEDME
jgi:hypothetical protein